MSIFHDNALIGASGSGGAAPAVTTPYSLRFEASASNYLSRVFGSTGNRKTYTLSFWFKRTTAVTSASYWDWFWGTSASNSGFMINYDTGFTGTEKAAILSFYDGSGTSASLQWNAYLKDVSAWYHLVLRVDTTQGTDTNRVRVYVNGVQADPTGALSTPVWYGPNVDTTFANVSGATHVIGAWSNSGSVSRYLNGYISNFEFVDGLSLDPSSFGETDTTSGVWKPKTYSGSYGNTGFKLAFSNIASTTTLGADSSGLGNNWTLNGFQGDTHYGRTTNTLSNGAIIVRGKSGGTVSGTISCAISSNLNFYTSSDGINWTRVGTGTSTFTFSSATRYIAAGGAGTTAKIIVSDTANAEYAPWNTNTDFDGPLSNTNNTTGLTYRSVVTGANPDSDIVSDSPFSSGTATGAGREVFGNFCVLNSDSGIVNQSSAELRTYSLGNLGISTPSDSGNQNSFGFGTLSVSSGKWYYEVINNNTTNQGVGYTGQYASRSLNNWFGRFSGVSDYSQGFGDYATSSISAGGNDPIGTVIGCALDFTANTITWYRDGVQVSQLTISAISSVQNRVLRPIVTKDTSADTHNLTVNFGQKPFIYTPPANHVGICSANLATPQVVKPSDYWGVLTWTGNGSSGTINRTGLNFQPGFAWFKNRSIAYHNQVYDEVRGAGTTKNLVTDQAFAEGSPSGGLYGYLSSFLSNGIALTTGTDPSLGNAWVNLNGSGYVSWCFKGSGTSGSTNNSGSITSTVSASSTSGFSIVRYNGNGGTGTVGHGLNRTPQMIIVKAIGSATESWYVMNTGYSVGAEFVLNSNAVVNASPSPVGISAVSDTTFTLGGARSRTNESGKTYIAYCWASIPGYSQIGTWDNNNNNSGTYIATGFRPGFLILKNTNDTEDWYTIDSTRTPRNLIIGGSNIVTLNPNAGDTEADAASGAATAAVDFYGNGFKIRTTNTASGEISFGTRNYIYIAIAESPAKYSIAR